MAASQFTIYSSSDASSPVLDGQAGSLLNLLQKCLVDGYGAKTAAGWSNPVASASSRGTFKNGAGSTQLTMHVSDNGPNGTSTYKEAWVTGWETCTAVSATVGTGSGQFPTPAQLLTDGKVVWRKSTAASAVTRTWRLAADAHTMYLFAQTGDYAGIYFGMMFGDIYSAKISSADSYRCLLVGRNLENSNVMEASGAALSALGDNWASYPVYVGAGGNLTAADSVGHYMARSWGGGGASVPVKKTMDLNFCQWQGGTTYNGVYNQVLNGSFRAGINGAENSIDLAPFTIFEGTGRRGRLRGLWQVCAATSSFSDGTTFSGAGDYAGKTFQIVGNFYGNGIMAIETSNTVETN